MESIATFISQHLPFSQLSPETIQQLSTTVQIEYFAAGSDILLQDGKPSAFLYMVRRGIVDLLHNDGQAGITVVDSLSDGELFGYASLIRNQPQMVTARAQRNTLAYLLPAATFQQLCNNHPLFAQFFAGSLTDQLNHALQIRHGDAAPELFQTRLSHLVNRRLITILPTASVRDAAILMRDQRVSSLLVTQTPAAPMVESTGIITDRDLRSRVVAAGLSYETPVSAVMSLPAISLPAESMVFEGLLLLLERGIHHLPVSEEGRMIGLITFSDILRRQSHNPLLLPRQIRLARSPEDLPGYTEQVSAAVGSLLDAGARMSDIGRMVAIAHDALIQYLLRDAEATLGPPPCAFAWLVFGSEGRYEQTLCTDQDNALVYADDAPPEAAAYFSALAERVVGQLITCGFPRCLGNIMATNPRLRQPLKVWKEYFSTWIETPDEQSLFQSTIFFDFRQLYGKLDAQGALRPIIQRTSQQGTFLGRLARSALRNHANLGFWRQFELERRHQPIDLKQHGVSPIVDLGRLFALETGVATTNTIARLRQAASRRKTIDSAGADDLTAAFELIGLLRLRHQIAQIRRGDAPTNYVVFDELTLLERRELKEALRAVSTIQSGVGLAYQTGRMA